MPGLAKTGIRHTNAMETGQVGHSTAKTAYLHWRQRVHALLEPDIVEPSRWNLLLNRLLLWLIVFNALAVILETVPWIYAEAGPLFHAFDVASVMVFTVEYVARVWCSVEPEEDADLSFMGRMKVRFRYVLSPLALVDLLAIVPFYLQWALLMDLRVLRLLRLLRVLKVTRYFPALSLLLEVIRQEARSIGAVLSILALMVVMSASVAYVFEHPAQPEVFCHIPAAMYWAAVTLTTVGYGDMVPITPAGQFLGAMIAVIGIGMVALPAGILSSAFSAQMRRSRKHYEEEVTNALADGLITTEEKHQLDILRDDLGLSEEEAEATLRAVVARRMHAEGIFMQIPRNQAKKLKDQDVL